MSGYRPPNINTLTMLNPGAVFRVYYGLWSLFQNFRRVWCGCNTGGWIEAAARHKPNSSAHLLKFDALIGLASGGFTADQ
jgi:hypothetical protein